MSIINILINNENDQYLTPSKLISYLALQHAFGYPKRGREGGPMDTVAFWVQLLSLEFPRLESITSREKAIVLSFKHNHMHRVHVYTHPCAHAQTHSVFECSLQNLVQLGLDLITLAKHSRFRTRGFSWMWKYPGTIMAQHEHHRS